MRGREEDKGKKGKRRGVKSKIKLQYIDTNLGVQVLELFQKLLF